MIKDLTVSGSVTGKSMVGGVIGYCYGYSNRTFTVSNCHFIGNVTATDKCVGGVIGECCVDSGDKNFVITVESCTHSGGTVTGAGSVGGVVGYCQLYSGSITVASCLNIGTVSRKAGSASTAFGAVTGVREGSGTVTVSDCYYWSGCIATDAGFTGDPDTGLTPLAHAITATLAQVYDETELRAAVTIGAKTIQLMNDIALSETLVVTGDKEITLDLNGQVLSLKSDATGSVIQVGNSSTTGKLTLKDSSTAEGAVDPAPTHKFSVDSDTGLWTLDEDNGTKTVTGGIITGGKSGAESATFGGGVYVYPGSSFTMNGGTVVGNTAHSGGGVYVDKSSTTGSAGTFTMNGGAIIGNTASNGGGGVYNKGGFNMTGGSIEGNSGGDGGGVRNSGSFTMTGGSISGNRSNVAGGGVCNSGSFTMSGDSEISGNEAAFYGGGVYVSNGTFTMEGGSISGNSAATTNGKENSGNGGGVYIEELRSANGNFNGTFNLTGGSITDNSATNTANDVTGYGSGNMSHPNKDSFKPSTGSKKVTFMADENTVYGVEVLPSTEDKATEPAQAPTKPNDAAGDYAFGKWYEQENGTFKAEKFDFTTTVTGDLTLYAKWLRVIKPEHITVCIDDVKQTDQTNAKATYDGKEHTVTFEIVVDGTTLNVDDDYAVTGNTTGTELGNYEFKISGKGDYAGDWTGGWKIEEAPVTGGSSTPTYSITAPTAANGTVTVSSKKAKKGAAVTVTVAPDKGYTLETLTILDKNGNEMALTDLGNGKYSFKMPAGKVTVKASFMEDNTMLNFFVDVPATAYYYDAVLWAAKNGITGGVDETHFGPDLSCTRAQLVTFLWRTAGCPVVNDPMNFTDVGDGYYTEAVRWAASLGIVGGYGNGLFGTDDAITREQFVTVLYRFAKAMGMDISVGEDTNILSYNDAFDVSEYAVEAFQWATGAGIVQGAGGDLMPQDPCTRAQIVTMLYRLLGE